MWDLALLLKAELERRGIAVVMTKSKVNQAVSLSTRGKASKGCDLLLSLHSDAASGEAPNWVSALHQVDDHCGEMDGKSCEIGKRLCEAVAQLMGVGTRMVARQSSSDRDGNGYKDDYYGVLRGAHTVGTPAVILEHGFHTNQTEVELLKSDTYRNKLARTDCKGILDYLGISIPVPVFPEVYTAGPQKKPSSPVPLKI